MWAGIIIKNKKTKETKITQCFEIDNAYYDEASEGKYALMLENKGKVVFWDFFNDEAYVQDIIKDFFDKDKKTFYIEYED